MSKILVTGGAGFIGSHVVGTFLAAGHDVAVVDDLSHGRRENLRPGVRLYPIDIRQHDELEKLFAEERPEFLCHHAALISVRESLEMPRAYADVNITAGIGLLELAARYGVRKVIYACSGGAAYGEGRDLPPFTEAREAHPLDPYGASKVAFEYYLHVYQQNYGLDYVSLRYANVYGPRQDPYGEGGVVAIFAQRIASGQPCTINGNGEKVRDFTYAGDVARANLRSLERGSGIYNIGTGAPTSVLALFRAMKGLSPGYDLEPVFGPDKPGEVWASCLDSAHARRELGWAPAISLDEGLARTFTYFQQQAPAKAEG